MKLQTSGDFLMRFCAFFNELEEMENLSMRITDFSEYWKILFSEAIKIPVSDSAVLVWFASLQLEKVDRINF